MSEERCETTELLVSHCGCTRHRGKKEEKEIEFSELGPWFPARFPGRCVDCGGPIEEGGLIRANGQGGYLGECCGEDDEPGLGLDNWNPKKG